jgi:hypothetical protein
MRDKKLLVLLVLITVLVTGHNVDHVLRDELPWPPSSEWLIFIVVIGVIYAAIGLTFLLYRRNRVGPRFFTIASLGGLVFGWLGHFSPYTDQPPSYILNAYQSATAGWIALSQLLALVLVLALTAVYSGYLWVRGVKN